VNRTLHALGTICNPTLAALACFLTIAYLIKHFMRSKYFQQTSFLAETLTYFVGGEIGDVVSRRPRIDTNTVIAATDTCTSGTTEIAIARRRHSPAQTTNVLSWGRSAQQIGTQKILQCEVYTGHTRVFGSKIWGRGLTYVGSIITLPQKICFWVGVQI
jgi:hypothetical protein